MMSKFLSRQRYSQFKLFCLDQILPLSCLICHQPSNHPLSLCYACQQLIPLPAGLSQIEDTDADNIESPLWHTIRCLSSYQSPVKELIQRGKFEKNLAALKVLGELFAKTIMAQGYDPELALIPVPLHHNRLIQRGYNQAYEIVLPIARKLGLTIHRQCITRVEEAQTQHLLTRQQRKNNAQNIFQAVGSVPKKVAVIDDVFTTGSTMRSICSCLQQAGAETIEVWIIARTLKQSSGILDSNHIK